MMSRKVLSAALMVTLGSAAATASAQSVIGFAPAMVIPVVAQTPTYTSEVFLGHQAGMGLTVAVEYVGAIGSAAPGLRDCGTLVIPPGAAGPSGTSFSLGSQCNLPPGSNFGMVFVSNNTPFENRGFFAYSRVQNAQAIGFSIEGFTPGSLSPQSQRVFGLKRVTGPGPVPVPIQTNCFVGSFEKPVNYRIDLYNSAGQGLGNVSGTLQPFELIRYLDIFAAAGVSGDHANDAARISSTNGGTLFPPYLSFCTVQDNISFGADFRIAKSFTAFDGTYSNQIFACEPPGCPSYEYAITNPSNKDVIAMFVRVPDQITCELKSDRLGDLEMQLRQPNIAPGPLTVCNPGSPLCPETPGLVVAGGSDQIAFAYDTGLEIVRESDGKPMRDFWSLEISAREGVTSMPVPYSVSCRNGSGTIFARPYQALDNF